jgi:hypothetical protein
MRSFLTLAGALALATSVATAQQGTTAKEKAPAGCIPCEKMCDWCVSLGKQPKAEVQKCHASCRSWGAMVGLSTVYVQKQRHLCGTKSYAPRCN